MRAWKILGLFWLLFLLYAYPGYASPDTNLQLYLARTGTMADWHPPMMAFAWRYVEYIWAGTLPMLLIQSGAFLFGLERILREFFKPRTAAIVAGSILLFPPVLTVMAVVWKDCQMAGMLLGGAALLLSERRRWKVLGCFCFFYATGVRYNALAATLPLVVLLFDWGYVRWRRYVLALGVWLVITAAGSLANSWITDIKDYPWVNSVALLDMAGTVKYSHVTDDAEIQKMLEGAPLVPKDHIAEKIRTKYLPTAHYQLTHEDDRIFDLGGDPAKVKAAWMRTVLGHPTAFIWHRWKVFRECLGMTSRGVAGPVETGGVENPSKIQKVWQRVVNWISLTWLYRAFIYFFIAFYLFVYARSRIEIALLLSGILTELSLFAGAPSNDYRYSHWMITCVVICTAIRFGLRYRAGRR
ncbi:MAG: hypothetical protein QM831_15885 [Kofleriaceae bacterium]